MGNSVGFWISCSGCTNSSMGVVDSEAHPPHPKHNVPQGFGCDECKNKGVIFEHFTKADEEILRRIARQP